MFIDLIGLTVNIVIKINKTTKTGEWMEDFIDNETIMDLTHNLYTIFQCTWEHWISVSKSEYNSMERQ